MATEQTGTGDWSSDVLAGDSQLAVRVVQSGDGETWHLMVNGRVVINAETYAVVNGVAEAICSGRTGGEYGEIGEVAARIVEAETTRGRTVVLDAEAPAKAPPRAADLASGAIYDFAAWLTTRPGLMRVGYVHNAAPMAAAVVEFLKFRGITEADPMVAEWQDFLPGCVVVHAGGAPK